MFKILLPILLFIQSAAIAQSANAINKSTPQQVAYYVLPDNGYTITQIAGNNTLPFVKGDSVRPAINRYYWLKIIIANPGHLTGSYHLFVRPGLNTTLYYFDANAQAWLHHTAGLAVKPSSYIAEQTALPFILHATGMDTVYARLNLTGIKKFGVAIGPAFLLQPAGILNTRQQVLWGGWIASIAVLLFFFLYNVYLYFSFRDESVLYYLVAQVGAMIYITGHRELYHIFLPYKLLNMRLGQDGHIKYYNVNYMMQHIGICIVLYGFAQLTRSYLNTKNHFRVADAILRYGVYFYLLASALLIFINSTVFFIDYYTLVYDNIFLMLLVAVIIFISVAGYRRKLRAAGPFLLANIIPLLLIIGIALFNVFVSMSGRDNPWMANLAIFSQALIFSVALVARTKLIQNDLKARELEAQQLLFDLREIGLRHDMIELENQNIQISIRHEKTRNEFLQQKLEANQRELASNTLYMVQKNEMLAKLKVQIEQLKKMQGGKKTGLSEIESILQSNFYLDDDWNKFKLHFEQVHPNFFENLQAKHPTLTNNEIRLCAYFHINLSAKEIAALLNIEPDSVRRAKSRLLKKMGDNEAQPNNDNPTDF